MAVKGSMRNCQAICPIFRALDDNVSVGRVGPHCPRPYFNASVGQAASAGARGSKINFISFLTIYSSFTKL
jgi:hypothetical protein